MLTIVNEKAETEKIIFNMLFLKGAQLEVDKTSGRKTPVFKQKKATLPKKCSLLTIVNILEVLFSHIFSYKAPF